MMPRLFSVVGLNLELLCIPGKHSTTEVYPSLVRTLFYTIHNDGHEGSRRAKCTDANSLTNLQPERLQAQALPETRVEKENGNW